MIELSRMIPTMDTASERRFQTYITVNSLAEIGIYCVVEHMLSTANEKLGFEPT